MKKYDKKTGKRHRAVPEKFRDETVYTEGKPVNITRFLLRIATVIGIVVALVFGMSIFFKVEKVEVSGSEKYSLQEIREASGIVDGENLLTLNKAKVAGKLLTELPYISSVRIGIRLPDTVVIQVVEATVAYAAKAEDGGWWLISSQGKVMERIDASASNAYTRILGVELKAPETGKTAEAADSLPENPDGETFPVTVYGKDRLETVLTILKELEKNGVLGKVATLDVTDMGAIAFWYEQRYQVLLGDSGEIPKKIFSVVQAIRQMSQYQTGILDASFTTWPDEVWHKKLRLITKFDTKNLEKNQNFY